MPYEIVFSMRNNVGIMGGVKKFVDLIIDEDNNEKENDCLIDNIFVEVNTSPMDQLHLSDDDEEEIVDDEDSLAKDVEIAQELENELINTRVTRSTNIRETVNVAQGVAAEKMCNKHDRKRNKVTREFEVGMHVSVKKDKIDKGSSELARIPCVISKIVNEKYELTTEFGILDHLRRADDLEPYHGLIEFDISKITDKIPLRTVCIKIADRNKPIKEIEIECNCNGKCSTKQCKCFKNGTKCHSHCHTKTENKCCINHK